MSSRETRRIRVQFLNDVASGTVVAAVVAPIIALLLEDKPIDWPNVGGLSLLALVLAVIIHDIACRLARTLEERP